MGNPLRNDVDLPPRPFMYAPDQIGQLLSLSTSAVLQSYLWFEGKHVGVPDPDRMRAVNISPGKRPEWRVSEQELIRWMRRKGLRAYERSRSTWVR